MRIAVFASGNGSNFEAIAKSIKNEGYAELVLLVTDNLECGVIERAKKYDLEVYSFVRNKKRVVYEAKVLNKLKELKVDFIALAGYMNIIGPTILDEYVGKIINIHPSLLPKYPGLNAIERAYKNKDTEIGVTIHYVDDGIDSGEIIAVEKILNNGESLIDLTNKIHEVEHRLYVDTLRGLL